MIQDKATKEYTDKIKASVTRTIEPKSKKAEKKAKKANKANAKAKAKTEATETLVGGFMLAFVIVIFWNFLSWIMP